MQFDAGLKGSFVTAVLGDTHIAGGDALDRALFVVKHLGRGKARKDLDAQLLRLARQPAADIAQADDVVPVVLHLARQQKGGEAGLAALAQEEELFLRHLGFEGRALVFPIRNQFGHGAWLDHRTRENVGADLGSFLDD